MLTVLHRRPDGTEHVFEAESVTRATINGEMSCPPGGEIVAHGVEGDTPRQITLSISEPFGAVFVMNRHGATIARYMHPA